MAGPLQLRAEDAEDIAVLSSCLQDALVPLHDMLYDTAAGQFILAVNRFRWEAADAAPPADPVFERIACGVTFADVRAVSLRGIDQRKRDQTLELLAVMASETGDDKAAAILLVFAGGGRIRLEAARIRARLEDFGEPWPTRWRPRHRMDQDHL